ncbi:reverse transcriptase domain protein [Colletotrichum tofieldiae]|nr:reverse transcriptase domain protein [Colletotrichum tofieldiae]GKT92420.1 reverse transcriptase domain protein [Colletotrichum tofieldiae]
MRTLYALLPRLEQRIKAQGNSKELYRLEQQIEEGREELEEEDPTEYLQKPTKIVAVGHKQAQKPRHPPPQLSIRERTPQDTIEMYAGHTSSEDEESLDEFIPPSKLQRRAAEQLRDVPRSSPSVTTETPSSKVRRWEEGLLSPLIEQDDGEAPYDSDEPLASQRYVDYSDTVPDFRPEVRKDSNDQYARFYGTEEAVIDHRPEKPFLESAQFGDHEYLDYTHPLHRRVFWADCIYDDCSYHAHEKSDHTFYPRRRGQIPIPDVYLQSEVGTWEIKEYNAPWLYFQPCPRHPMPCVNKITKHWSDCLFDKCKLHYEGKARTWRTQIKEVSEPTTTPQGKGKRPSRKGLNQQSKN